MTERELLERAAKAAGIDLQWPQDLGGADFLSPTNISNWKIWNPLHDDGDALRLAVNLRLLGDTGLTFQFMEAIDYEATRCAIVRAAASRNGAA